MVEWDRRRGKRAAVSEDKPARRLRGLAIRIRGKLIAPVSAFAKLLGQEAAQQAAASFGPEIERVVRYARMAAWFGVAGFVVGLLALVVAVVLAFMVL